MIAYKLFKGLCWCAIGVAYAWLTIRSVDFTVACLGFDPSPSHWFLWILGTLAGMNSASWFFTDPKGSK